MLRGLAMPGFGLVLVLALAACGAGPRLDGATLGESRAVECAPFARAVSGIRLSGDAADWWAEAVGRYPRSARPEPGAVLVFRRSPRLASGHVSVVRRVVSGREILVTQANWVHHRIGRADPVVDVSPGNDWTAVRVWWAPAGRLGTSVYPTEGFVGPSS